MRHPVRVSIAAALLLCLSSAAEYGAFASDEGVLAVQPVQGAPEASFEQFLDRLMRAELNGRDTAANPRSTALGAFQFIESTFLAVTRQHFAREVAELSDSSLLELRTNRAFARRAAAAYCKMNAAYLSEQGITPTFGHLRLAYLLGSVGRDQGAEGAAADAGRRGPEPGGPAGEPVHARHDGGRPQRESAS